MRLPKIIEEIMERYWKSGLEAYLVGGCVRDYLLGNSPKDYDITTSALPQETKELFPEYKTLDTGIQHGTVSLMIGDLRLEITTYRIDGDYLDHRRPERITFTKSLREDLRRRDFTVNAMAYYKELRDYFHGREDLIKKQIRCVGEPERRFEEDGLRILRALRFASVLGFSVEDKTKNALYAKKTLLREISGERIQEEWRKLLSGRYAPQVVMEYQEIIEVFLPGFQPCALPERLGDDWLARFCCLLYSTYGADIDKIQTVLNRMRFDKKTCRKIQLLIPVFESDFSVDKVSVKKYLNHLGQELTQKAALIKGVDISQVLMQIQNNGECYTLSGLCLRGEDLIRLGCRQGKEVGEALDDLLEYVMEFPEKNTPEDLILKLRDKFSCNLNGRDFYEE